MESQDFRKNNEWAPLKWAILCLLLVAVLCSAAWSDTITIGSTTYTDVKIHESDTRYYVTLPDGKAMSVSKADVKPEDVKIEGLPSRKVKSVIPKQVRKPVEHESAACASVEPATAPPRQSAEPIQTGGHSLGRGTEFSISNDAGVPDIGDYQCGSFSQRVIARTPNTVTIHVEAAEKNPIMRQSYPVLSVPEDIQLYLAATPHIQSDDPSIAAIAKSIADSVKSRRAHELVEAVCRYVGKHMQYGLSNEVPDAVLCLKRRLGNCIGFAHLSAAILRNLGIPCRTVRVYVAYECGHLNRHSIIEVYYPEDHLWVMYETQTGGNPPPPKFIYAYNDPDWNKELQRVVWRFSNDSKTKVLILKKWEPREPS